MKVSFILLYLGIEFLSISSCASSQCSFKPKACSQTKSACWGELDKYIMNWLQLPEAQPFMFMNMNDYALKKFQIESLPWRVSFVKPRITGISKRRCEDSHFDVRNTTITVFMVHSPKLIADGTIVTDLSNGKQYYDNKPVQVDFYGLVTNSTLEVSTVKRCDGKTVLSWIHSKYTILGGTAIVRNGLTEASKHMPMYQIVGLLLPQITPDILSIIFENYNGVFRTFDYSLFFN